MNVISTLLFLDVAPKEEPTEATSVEDPETVSWHDCHIWDKYILGIFFGGFKIQAQSLAKTWQLNLCLFIGNFGVSSSRPLARKAQLLRAATLKLGETDHVAA